MDNNNSLPYGAISSTNDNLHLQQRHFIPTEVSSSSNSSTFNPLLVARNVNLDHPIQENRNNSHVSSRHSRSTVRNNPYRIPQLNYNSNSNSGQNLPSTSSNLSDSNVPLIIDAVPLRDNETIDTSNLLSDTRISNVQSNRYFHPPWSTGERTQDDTSRSTNHGSDANMATSRAGAHLPIIREESTPSTVTTSFEIGDTYRKHSLLKRRVSRDEADDGLPRPASKVQLTEEKMAAKMHNLQISNDHSYHLNGLQTPLAATHNSIVSDLSFSQPTKSNANKETGEHKEDDNNNMESGDASMFVLAPGFKEVFTKNNQLLPQCIIDQISKPCLAVIPWKPQDNVMARLSLNFNKTDDEKAAEKNTDYFKSKITSDANSQPNAFSERTVHSEAMDELSNETFEFDEDDMDL